MSKEEVKAIVSGFWRALLKNDVAGMFSFCAKDLTITWGLFTFKGESEVRTWAEEFNLMFPLMRIVETECTVQESTVKHKLVIMVDVPDGRRGMLPALSIYDFEDGKIQNIRITLSPGTIIVNMEKLDISRARN